MILTQGLFQGGALEDAFYKPSAIGITIPYLRLIESCFLRFVCAPYTHPLPPPNAIAYIRESLIVQLIKVFKFSL